MHVRMYACTYVCMYVRMHVRTSACMYVCIHVRLHVRTYACTYVCKYVEQAGAGTRWGLAGAGEHGASWPLTCGKGWRGGCGLRGVKAWVCGA